MGSPACGSCGSEGVTGKFIVSKPTSKQQFHTHKQFEAQQPAHSQARGPTDEIRYLIFLIPTTRQSLEAVLTLQTVDKGGACRLPARKLAVEEETGGKVVVGEEDPGARPSKALRCKSRCRR